MLSVKSEFKALGTDILLFIACKSGNQQEKAKKDLEKIKKIYSEQEKKFSRFDPKSELSFLNNNLGKFNSASSDIIKVAKKSQEYYQRSRRMFDPRIIKVLENIGYRKDFKKNYFRENTLQENQNDYFGDIESNLKIKGNQVFFGKRMDFSGVAKGYITDKVSEFLKSRGWKNFLVDSGGDIFAAGCDESGEKWKISLEGIPEEKMLIEISEEAVATSGITRRKWEAQGKKFHHLVNPKKPDEFNFDLKSVTVIRKNTTEADVWAKVLFLMGKKKGLEFSKINKIKSLFLDYKGNLYLSKEIKKCSK